MRRSAGILASDSGKSSTQIGSLLLLPSIVIAEVTPTDSTPPMASMRLRNLFMHARDLRLVADHGGWNRDAKRQHGFRTLEPRRHIADRDEGADHQAGRDEQHGGQRDLRDDQRVARTVTLAAFARSARAVLQRRGHVRPRVLQDRDRAEQQARDQRDTEREEQHDRIERDLVQARQLRRLQVDQQLNAAIRERDAEHAAEHGDRQRLRHQLPGDLPRFGAERETNRQLLLTRLGAHEKQVRDVRARHEQHESDGAKQDPQHAADVADDIDIERPHQRPEPCIVEHLLGEARRQRKPLGQ